MRRVTIKYTALCTTINYLFHHKLMWLRAISFLRFQSLTICMEWVVIVFCMAEIYLRSATLIPPECVSCNSMRNRNMTYLLTKWRIEDTFSMANAANVEALLFGLTLIQYGGYADCQGAVQLTPNVALRGTATQSSNHVKNAWAASPFVASHANDGNTEASMTRTNGACSIVGRNTPVWWQVDLKKVYEITKVAVTRWTSRNLNNFYIDVSNHSDGSSALQCAHEPDSFNTGETRVYTCPCGLYGRYVRVRRSLGQSTPLWLCEVQVQSGVQHCSDPGSIENGQIEGNAPFNCFSTVNYSCNYGYWLLGAETLRCGISGQWDHSKPACFEKDLGCGEPPMMNNAQRFGNVSNVTYQCDEGYIGGASATCQNGKWNHQGSCKSNAAEKDKENDGGKQKAKRITEENKDGLLLGLTAVGSTLGGILITLLAVFLCKRHGIDPCARFEHRDSPKKTNDGYEKPNVSPDSAKVEEEEYAELDDMAGYEIPVSH